MSEAPFSHLKYCLVAHKLTGRIGLASCGSGMGKRRVSGIVRHLSSAGRRLSSVGRRPSGEGRRPSGEGRRPSGEDRRPSGEGRRPSGEGRRPSGEGRRLSGTSFTSPYKNGLFEDLGGSSSSKH